MRQPFPKLGLSAKPTSAIRLMCCMLLSHMFHLHHLQRCCVAGDHAAMKCWEPQREELLSLKSIYCSPEECCLLSPPSLSFEVLERAFEAPPDPVTVEVKLQVPVSHQGDADEPALLKVALVLPKEYPLSEAPHVSISSPDISEHALTELAHSAAHYAEGFKPHPSLFDILERLKQLATEMVDCTPSYLIKSTMIRRETSHSSPKTTPSQVTKSSSDVYTDSVASCRETDHICVAKLDHMRNRQKYVKTLQQWSEELGVRGKIVDGGLHNIYVVLLGREGSVREFVRRWRTQSVDDDSRGRPCKERMVSVLCQKPFPTEPLQVAMGDCER